MTDQTSSPFTRVVDAESWFSRHRVLMLLVLGALVLRVAVALKLNPFFGDQDEYLSGAHRLLDGEPLPVLNYALFVRAPGYSIFIALIWWITHTRTLLAVRLAQAIVSTGTCLFVYLLALRIRRDPRVAIVAFCLAAGYPYFLFHVGAIGSECAFAFLVVLGSYYFVRALEREAIAWGYMVAAVLAYAAGILLRPNLAPAEAAFGLLLAWRYRRRWGTVLAIGLVMVAGTLVVTMPWSVAVERQGLGRLFVSDGGGLWYHVGHSDLAERIYCEHTRGRERSSLVGGGGWLLDPIHFAARTLPRSQQASLFWKTSLHWDAEHPSAQLCLAAGKFWMFWRPWVEPHAYSLPIVAMSFVSFPLLLLGLTGIWKLREEGNRGLALVVIANVATATILALVYSTEIRYRIPVVDLLLMPYAACLLVEGIDRLTRIRTDER
jgi:hypothetical protein